MIKYLEFEKDVEKIDELINNYNLDESNNTLRLDKLKKEKNEILKKLYSNLDPWQKVQVSRHSDRPHTLD